MLQYWSRILNVLEESSHSSSAHPATIPLIPFTGMVPEGQSPVLSVKEPLHLSLNVVLGIFILLVERESVKGEWSSVYKGSGELCVIVDLEEKKQ